jgi:hypothetical protein
MMHISSGNCLMRGRLGSGDGKLVVDDTDINIILW